MSLKHVKTDVMPKMDGSGPVGQGYGAGRKIGKCSSLSPEEKAKELGLGMGKRRKAGGGDGNRKRHQEGNQF
ncbi:MAG: DUF5320 family protein [Petrimonas sp.]|nr:DUF5320 family protein [Petrimonas sp.]